MNYNSRSVDSTWNIWNGTWNIWNGFEAGTLRQSRRLNRCRRFLEPFAAGMLRDAVAFWPLWHSWAFWAH